MIESRNQRGEAVPNQGSDKEFLTIKMLATDPCCPFSEKALRFHIWRSGLNGLAPAIYRIGKKVLIKRSEWIKWIESHAQKSTRRGQNE